MQVAVRARVAAALPTRVLGSEATALLVLNVVDPTLVARNLVERWERDGTIDTYYRSSLSTYAAPALNRLPESLRGCVSSVPDQPGGWPSWNLARSRVDRVRDHPPLACNPGS